MLDAAMRSRASSSVDCGQMWNIAIHRRRCQRDDGGGMPRQRYPGHPRQRTRPPARQPTRASSMTVDHLAQNPLVRVLPEARGLSPLRPGRESCANAAVHRSALISLSRPHARTTLHSRDTADHVRCQRAERSFHRWRAHIPPDGARQGPARQFASERLWRSRKSYRPWRRSRMTSLPRMYILGLATAKLYGPHRHVHGKPGTWRCREAQVHLIARPDPGSHARIRQRRYA